MWQISLNKPGSMSPDMFVLKVEFTSWMLWKSSTPWSENSKVAADCISSFDLCYMFQNKFVFSFCIWCMYCIYFVVNINISFIYWFSFKYRWLFIYLVCLQYILTILFLFTGNPGNYFSWFKTVTGEWGVISSFKKQHLYNWICSTVKVKLKRL